MIDHRSVKAKVKNPTPRQRKAAANLASGMTIRQSMLDAGYSANTALQGFAAVPATVLALMPAETNFVELGRALTAEQQENLVRGRLMMNVIKGKDAGVNSAYRLGQDKRVNMFTADSQVGVIVVQAPAGVSGKEEKIPDEEK